MRQKKEHYIILTPRNDAAKLKMAHHGDKWIIREELEFIKFLREPGPWLKLVSRNGEKVLFVKKNNDPYFITREV